MKDEPCCPRPAEEKPCCAPPAAEADDEPCCGRPVGPASDPSERPGYRLLPFVSGFQETPIGPVPRVRTRLSRADLLSTLRVRLGIGRYDYKVAPGLYCVGTPDRDAPVLVTADFKLSFDALRRELDGVDAWILVLDTRGINVWCAAGKGTFGTDEVVRRVEASGLDRVVRRRKLVLPQLGAPGVAARKVREACGFQVIWGPVRARDIRAFLEAGMKASEEMRRVSFTAAERTVLIPIELNGLITPTLWAVIAAFALSGIGPGVFSCAASWTRGWMMTFAYGAGAFAGTVAVPVLLPWIPGRALSLKGALAGLVCGLGVAALALGGIRSFESASLVLCAAAVSSFTAMNFTGTTPYTSASGVEKEMRAAMPIQAGALAVAVVVWVVAAFTGGGS